MSIVLNMVGGGGGKLKDTDAILSVTAPTGSTITATKGAITLTPTIWTTAADNNSDCAIFIIKASQFDSNPWTVTATLSGETSSDTVVIDSAKEYSVRLRYGVYIFKNGAYDVGGQIDVTRAYSTSGWTGTATITDNKLVLFAKNDNGGTGPTIVYYTRNTVSLTPYSKLFLTVDSYYGDNNVAYFGVYSNYMGQYNTNAVAIEDIGVQTGSPITYTIDVSNLSSTYYIAVKMWVRYNEKQLTISEWGLSYI